MAELDNAGLLVTRERPQPRKMEFADLGKLTYLSWVCKVCLPTIVDSKHHVAGKDVCVGFLRY